MLADAGGVFGRPQTPNSGICDGPRRRLRRAMRNYRSAGIKCPEMIHVALTDAAYDAIASTLLRRKMSDDRQYAPATLRNHDFILDVLRDVLPTTGDLHLEVASGSGEQIVHFGEISRLSFSNLPILDPDALLSVAAWVKTTGVTNVRAPIALDASRSLWPIASADGIICINMVHISPWETTLGLIKGAAAIASSGVAVLSLWSVHSEGFATASSNQAFDRSLRDRNPSWGLRDLEAVAAMAQSVRILGSGYHRYARKQSERGVPTNLTLTAC